MEMKVGVALLLVVVTTLLVISVNLKKSSKLSHNDGGRRRLLMGRVINDPKTQQAKNDKPLRVMYNLIAYTYDHKFRHQAHLVQNVRDMCEAGFEMELHIFTAEEDLKPFQMLTDDGILYCERAGASIPVRYHQFRPQIGDRLPCQPRDFITNRLNDFDYFLVTEDDIDIRPSHLRLRIRLDQQLREDMPDLKTFTGWLIYDQDEGGQSLSSWGTVGVNATTFGSLGKAGENWYLFDPPFYHCGFFLSRQQVQTLINANEWSSQSTEQTIFGGPNTPIYPRERCLGLYFLGRHFGRFVVPVADMRALMVNHLTNKYAPDMHQDPPIHLKSQIILDHYGFKWSENDQRLVLDKGKAQV